MKRHLLNALKGGWFALSVFFALWSLVLSFKNDTKPIPVQLRLILWIVTALAISYILLGVAIHNQNKQLKSLGHYHIERVYPEGEKISIIIEYLPFLAFDYAVTIATSDDKRERVLGIGKIINVQPDKYIEIEVIHKEKNPIWEDLEHNDKDALEKSYVLPTIKANEVKDYGKGNKTS